MEKQYCKCHAPLNLKEGIACIVDEAVEFWEEPSKDELSDVVYGINRAIGGLFNKSYIRVIPGDKIHVDKIDKRMAEHGCIRSKRHLVNGVCPSN